jgi:hypothetical protein
VHPYWHADKVMFLLRMLTTGARNTLEGDRYVEVGGYER